METGISDNEVKATLLLRESFSRDPIVIDVGSNKGGWASILVQNVKEMHLFEPNEVLLHYSMIRFDTLTNVIYNPIGVLDKTGKSDFFYFTNYNNGLSSIYFNERWINEGLPMQKKMINTVSLDEYWYDYCKNDKVIDMVKIDVEGADYQVLLGCRQLLEQKKIKAIQIEKSEHYSLAGKTFDDVVKFLKPLGYLVFHFNGETFDPYTDQEAENLYVMEGFTQDWNSEFKKNTKGIKVETALEIGCFEGLTTNYICDNLLKEGGRIVCVDPLTDEYLPGHKDNAMFVGQYDRFIRNTAGRPVELIRKKSIDAYEQLKDLRFGFIYIDGDHTEEGVFNDAVMYWNLLLDTPRWEGGYMLFDDYLQSEETRRGIDRFLHTQRGNYNLLVRDYQILIRRLW